MKTAFLAIVFALSPVFLLAQGTVDFMNFPPDGVTNSLTGEPAQAAEGMRVTLYYAPDGVTDPSLFVPLGASAPVGVPLPGMFVGGIRTAPSTTCMGCYASFQVRAFEAAYGSTYEEAAAAPPMNGRPALLGESSVLRVLTGGGWTPPPALYRAGLTGFSVYSGPRPSLLRVSSVGVHEPVTGTRSARFVVQLQPPTAQGVSVEFATADGTATAGLDYVATSGTLVFGPGETTQTIEVLVAADATEELIENFFVELFNPVHASLTEDRAEGSISEIHITEVRTDTAVTFHTVENRGYVFERSPDMVQWSTVSGADQVIGNGDMVTVIDPGSGCAGGRFYRARLLDLDPLLSSGLVGSEELSRINFQNRQFDSPVLSGVFPGQSASQSEGIQAALYYAPDGIIDPGRFVQLGDSVPVGIPVPGIFSAGRRNIPATTAPGGYAMFEVRVWEQAYGATYEEAMSVGPLNGRLARIGSSGILRLRTVGLEQPALELGSYLTPISLQEIAGNPKLISLDLVVAEGPAGTVTANMTLRLNRASADAVTISYATADGSAQAGSDYLSANGLVTFGPGEREIVVQVTLTADAPIEPDEFFHLDVSSASDVTILRPRSTCTITQAHISGLRLDTSISFNSLRGQIYALETSVDLKEWSPVASAQHLVGTGGLIQGVHEGSGCDPTRHYRVVLVP